MTNQSIHVIIPVYRPDEKLEKLLSRLNQQTKKPNHIYLIHTKEETWNAQKEQRYQEMYDCIPNATIMQIQKQEFDHGKTRNFGASFSQADILLFMTQDAVPADEKLIEELVTFFKDPTVAVSYARQLPGKESDVLEQYTREFNYPKQSCIKTKKDIKKLGIKTYFCSNVCAAYRADIFRKLGGFPDKTIFNEDMIFAAKAIQANYKIAYAANACVIHAHHYNGREQFHRNFDLGVSQSQHFAVFSGLSSEKEGIKMVKSVCRRMILQKKGQLIPLFFWQSFCKYLGFSLGKRYPYLPVWLCKKCSMQPDYWTKKSYSKKG